MPEMPEAPDNFPEYIDGQYQAVERDQPITLYKVRNAAYALQPHPPINYVVEGLISEGSLSVFFGEAGSKKTFALISLAVCVALGKPWLEFPTNKRKVLIIDEESGDRRLTKRIGDAVRGELGDESTQLEYVSYPGFKLDKGKDAVLLQAFIEDTGAGLVIIDALSEIMDGDENLKKDTQPVINNLKKIAEQTNSAIILIHHANRSGGYRGSSAIKGTPDLMLKIESEEGSQWISFKTEKTRDIESTNFTAVAHWTDDQFYLSGAKSKVKPWIPNRSQAYVIKYLADHGASTMQAIMGAADSCSPNAARQSVYSLVNLGKAYRTNPDDNGRGAMAIFDLKERPTDEDD